MKMKTRTKKKMKDEEENTAEVVSWPLARVATEGIYEEGGKEAGKEVGKEEGKGRRERKMGGRWVGRKKGGKNVACWEASCRIVLKDHNLDRSLLRNVGRNPIGMVRGGVRNHLEYG